MRNGQSDLNNIYSSKQNKTKTNTIQNTNADLFISDDNARSALYDFNYNKLKKKQFVIKKTDRQNGKRKNNHKTIEKQAGRFRHLFLHKNKKNYIIRQ